MSIHQIRQGETSKGCQNRPRHVEEVGPDPAESQGLDDCCAPCREATNALETTQTDYQVGPSFPREQNIFAVTRMLSQNVCFFFVALGILHLHVLKRDVHRRCLALLRVTPEDSGYKNIGLSLRQPATSGNEATTQAVCAVR